MVPQQESESSRAGRRVGGGEGGGEVRGTGTHTIRGKQGAA